MGTTASIKVVCASCHARFHLAEGLVRAKVVTFRCKKCKGPIEVDGRDLASAAVEAPAANPETFEVLPLAPHPTPPESPAVRSPLPHSEPRHSSPLALPHLSAVIARPAEIDFGQSARLSMSDGWEGSLPAAQPTAAHDGPTANASSIVPASSPESAGKPKVLLTDRVLRPPPALLLLPEVPGSQPTTTALIEPNGAAAPTLPRNARLGAFGPPQPFPPSSPFGRGSPSAPPTVVSRGDIDPPPGERPSPARKASKPERLVTAALIGAACLAAVIATLRHSHGTSPAATSAKVEASRNGASALHAEGPVLASPPAEPSPVPSPAAPAANEMTAASSPPAAAPSASVSSRDRAARRRAARSARSAARAESAEVAAPDPELSGAAASAAQVMADVMRDREFDRDAARVALDRASRDAVQCRSEETAAHAARFAITFAPTGRVSSAEIEGGPLVGTAVGTCMADAFRTAQVPTFGGAPVVVHKNVAF